MSATIEFLSFWGPRGIFHDGWVVGGGVRTFVPTLVGERMGDHIGAAQSALGRAVVDDSFDFLLFGFGRRKPRVNLFDRVSYFLIGFELSVASFLDFNPLGFTFVLIADRNLLYRNTPIFGVSFSEFCSTFDFL